jgi:glycosyltransferase involved in cell wall biosynthesis
MKVFHLIARVNRGGTANWISNLFSGLRAQGHEVELFAGFVENNEIEDSCFSELNGRRIKSLKRSLSALSDALAVIEFRKILKKEKPDILNTHTAKAGVIGRIASIGLPVKTVHTFHGHVLYGYFNPIQVKIYLLIERFMALFTDVFIAVGEKVKIELISAGIGKPDKYIVISPAIPSAIKIDEAVARVKLKLPNDQITVGWLGRFVQIKRPDRLIDLARRNPNINFVMGGEGELLSEIENTAPSNVYFVGWVNPLDFWSACNLAILTSDNEGLPTSLIEAGLLGLPIITLNVGSASEIVDNFRSGFVIEDLVEADALIQNLASNRSLMLEMGANSQNYCLSKFNLEIFIKRNLAAYRM